jgi:hypothetical protein
MGSIIFHLFDKSDEVLLHDLDHQYQPRSIFVDLDEDSAQSIPIEFELEKMIKKKEYPGRRLRTRYTVVNDRIRCRIRPYTCHIRSVYGVQMFTL